MSKGYKSDELKAKAAFVIINELMGELHAARMVFLFASDDFLDLPNQQHLKETLDETALIYLRRLSISSFASVMYKFIEIYDNFLKPLGCATNEAKSLRKKIPIDKLDEFRHINQHILDKETSRHHSIDKIKSIVKELEIKFPDLFKGDISNMIIRFESIRNTIETKYPSSRSYVKERHEQFIK